MKFMFIQEETNKVNPLARQYLEKLGKEEVSIDWAHRVLVNSIRSAAKNVAIADETTDESQL
jgi:hypothetical protein